MAERPLPTEFAPPPAPPLVTPETALCRVSNPSQRPRVIYGGANSDKLIHIRPGQTVEEVLSDPLIDKLLEQENIDPDEPGLKVIELGPPPPPKPPERVQRRARLPRAA